MKMKLRTEVGLGPCHIVLDGDPAPCSPKGYSPQFSAHVYCGQTAGWTKMPLGIEVDLGPATLCYMGTPLPSPKKWGTAPSIFGPMFVVLLWPNDWMDQHVTWYGARSQPRPHCVRWESNCPPEGTAPNFRPMFIVAKRSPISAAAEHLLKSFHLHHQQQIGGNA